MDMKRCFTFSLGSSSKQASDERQLTQYISFVHAIHLTLSDHVHHFIPMQGSALATWDICSKMERRRWLYPFVFFAISPMKRWRSISLQRFLA